MHLYFLIKETQSMKKSRQGNYYPAIRSAIKTVLMIKLTLILVLALTLQSFGRGFGQKKITLNLKNVELKQALKTLEAQGEYRFVYKDEIIPKGSKVSLKVDNASLEQVLDKILENTPLGYKQLNDQLIVITKDKSEMGDAAPFAKAVSGRVVNEQGTPLAGVTILEKGTTNGTSTKEDGSFALTVASDNSSLEISFVGYVTQTVRVGDQSSISIRMVAASRQMDEVVVVGYGTQRRNQVTAAISSVKSEELSTVSATRIDQALQGRTPGVNVLPTSGAPGAGIRIQIRGLGTNGNGNPLYIVDGVEPVVSITLTHQKLLP